MSYFTKIRPMGADLFHTDGHMTKLIVAFRNFTNAPKKCCTPKSHDYEPLSYRGL